MSVEEVEDEDNIRPQKAIPKKGSRILERADGSDDVEDDDNALIDVDSSDSSDEQEATDIEDLEVESAEESAEAELGKCAKTRVCFKIKLTKLNRKTI